MNTIFSPSHKERTFSPQTPGWASLGLLFQRSQLILLCMLWMGLLLVGCTPGPEPASEFKSWVTTSPGSTVTSQRLATDKEGHLYACGVFYGTLTLGTFQLQSKELHALYFARLNAAGEYEWAHQVGQAQPGLALTSCKAARDGNLLLTGYYYKSMTFDKVKLPAQSQVSLTNAFLAQVSPSGQVLWALGVPGSSGAQGSNIAISPTGELWWIGFFRNTGTFQDITLQTQKSNEPQMFLAHLNRRGEFLRVITTPGYSVGTDVQIDAAGRITLAGIFQKILIIGSETHISRGKSDIFVAQLSKEARVLWSTSLGGKSNDNGVGIASGQDGHTYIHATLEGDAQIGKTKHEVKGGKRHILTRVDPQGNFVWSRDITTVQQVSPMLYERLSVAVSAQNNVYLLAEYSTPNRTQFNFALSIIPNLEGASRQNIIPQPSGQGAVGKDLVIDSQGHAIITGWLQGSTTLQQHQLNDTGSPSTFIWKMK